MAEGSLLVDLLFAAQEPGEAKYQRISSDILTRPDILANLFRNGQDSLLLLRQARRGHRLVKIFGSLFSLSNQQYRPLHLDRLATTCSSLFTRIISNSRDTDLDLLVAVISPALKICLGSGLREARGLATVVVQHDGLLERVINNDLGAAAISSWTFSPVIRQQDVFTLGSCADKLVDLVSHCAAEHHHSEELASWEDLKYLTKSLKQAGRTQQNLHNGPFLVEAGDAKFLAKFCLTIPESIRKLSETIQELETRKTIAILQALANTFPCNLCRETLRRGAPIQFINTASTEFHHPRTPQFGMEVFGRNIGHWEVLLSTPALSALLNRHQMKTLTIIKEKLSTLARGMHHKTALAGCRPARQLLKVPLWITQCRSDIFIVWQIDVDMLYETGSPGQIIRVWDIVTASEIERLLEHVTVIQSTWTEETINRCRQGSSFNLEERTPVIYHPSSTGEIVADLRKRINLDVRSKDQYFYNLIGKFFPFTESFFNHRDNRRASLDFPYKLSSYEKEIVCQSNTSSIIRGRSGTGKTTCLVYKLLGKHIASKQMGQDRPLKQILLTRSLQLADKIRHDVRRILETLLPGSDSDAKVQNITASAFMDRTFVNPPDPLYPLVCTFEEFLERLENTASVFDAPEQQEQDRPQNVVDQRNANETRDDCVDYPKFKEEYWPILSRENEQKLPMSLVFAEIMGVIKGSNASAVSLGPLTCEEYLQQSSRIAPAFAIEAERIALYKLFRSYEKLKCERNEVDYVDRVLNVLSSLQKTPALKQILQAALDEVYVDEVQDQRSVDVKLLLTLVGDVRCFHVAGDNAQAIAQESNFRFEDLKAMIHTHFSDGSDTNKKPFKRPQMFELGLNYRSHDGIVRLGSFVMGLLWKCFPETVDKLKPEEGLLLGPIPILFVGCEPDILAKVSNEESTLNVDKVKFGAEQVVLVRDEQEKARLKNYIGGVALVLTIRQSKGMEFDDVVLFDFFTSSPEPGGWRNVHEVLGDKPANFDSQRYITMCAELKNLYVSVTRARNKLFIIETGSHYSLSFIAQLLTHCTPESVVKLIKRDDYEFNQNIQLLRPDRMTNPKRWIERGSDLMTDGHYREALHCFEQANHHHGIKLVEAKIHQAEGNACFAIHDRVAAAEAFNSSITLFLELHQTEDAVGICCKMGWLERAGRLWFDQHDYHKAARLFNNAKLYIRAAECYENLQMFSEAAEVLWGGEEFNELVRCLVHHRQDFPPLILDTYVSLCKVPLKGKKLSTSHRKEVISPMGSSKEREDLLRRYEIYDVLDELLLQEKRFSDLFRLRCDLGDLDGALELTLRGKQIGPLVDVEEQIQQLTDHVVTGRLLDNLKRRKKISDKILGDLKKSATTEQQKRVREWSLAINCLESDDGLSVSKIGLIHSDLMRLVIALQILDLDSMGKRPPLETLLSRRIQTAIAITKDAIMMGVRAQNLELLLTVCGVWNTGNPRRPYIVKAWSPLPKETALATFDDTTLAAKNWLTDRLSTFIASLDDASEYRWNISYPWRCAHFLTKGFPEGRRWQERLIRGITMISSFEQAGVIVQRLSSQLRGEGQLSHIVSGLEELLIFRLKEEWPERSGYSSLVEQMQLATALGVHARFSRVFSQIAYSKNERSKWEQLDLLSRLEKDVREANAQAFCQNMAMLRTMLDNIVIDGFTSFHSVTTTVEYLTTYLIFRVCVNGFAIPFSWLYQYIPRLYETAGLKKIPEAIHQVTYKDGLATLVQGLCSILRRLDQFHKVNRELPHQKLELLALDQQTLLKRNFRYGKRDYPALLLQPRNVELLAVAVLNLKLDVHGDQATRAFQPILKDVEEVFKLDTVKQAQLCHSGNIDYDCWQLAQAYNKYHGKDHLVIVKRGSKSILRDVRRVERMSMDQVLALHPFTPPARSSSEQAPSFSAIPKEFSEPKDIKSITKIQLWWRNRLSMQSFLTSFFQDWQIARLRSLMAVCPVGHARIALRIFFVRSGFGTLNGLAKARSSYLSVHQSIMSAFDVVKEIAAVSQLEQALTISDDIQKLIEDATLSCSDAELKNMIKDGDWTKIRLRFDEADVVIKQLKQRLDDIDTMLKEAHKAGNLA